ncbi:MAG: hypothetical protein AAGC71_01220 [Pseudomonadota bacterium]
MTTRAAGILGVRLIALFVALSGLETLASSGVSIASLLDGSTMDPLDPDPAPFALRAVLSIYVYPVVISLIVAGVLWWSAPPLSKTMVPSESLSADDADSLMTGIILIGVYVAVNGFVDAAFTEAALAAYRHTLDPLIAASSDPYYRQQLYDRYASVFEVLIGAVLIVGRHAIIRRIRAIRYGRRV